jgi:hypothetical protein
MGLGNPLDPAIPVPELLADVHSLIFDAMNLKMNMMALDPKHLKRS